MFDKDAATFDVRHTRSVRWCRDAFESSVNVLLIGCLIYGSNAQNMSGLGSLGG